MLQTKSGLYFVDESREKHFINFAECRENWTAHRIASDEFPNFDQEVAQNYKGNCVADRDAFAQSPYFKFYTVPPTFIEFPRRRFFSRHRQHFLKLQLDILNAGWTTYDLG